MPDFTGKTVIITGGTRGIGRALCRAYLAAGACVYAFYSSNEEAALSLRQEYTAGPAAELAAGMLCTMKVAVEDSAQVALAVRQVKKERQGIDILINNAGVFYNGFLAVMDEKHYSRMIDINLKGPVHMAKYVARIMLAQKYGHILNMSSLAATEGFAGLAVYGATKAGLMALTKSLAAELGPANIIVNGLAPGLVATEMTAHLPAALIAQYRSTTGNHELLTASDVTGWCLRLTGPEGALVQGETITLTGKAGQPGT